MGSKENATIVPLGYSQAAKAQPPPRGRYRRMHADGCGRQRNNAIEGTGSPLEQRLRLPPRHDPTIDISRGARIQLFQHFARGVTLVKLQSQSRVQRSDALRHYPSPAFGQNEPQTGDSAAAA